MVNAITRALQEMSLRRRTERAVRDTRVWQLHCEGLTTEVIAERTRIGRSTVQKILSKCRAAETGL